MEFSIIKTEGPSDPTILDPLKVLPTGAKFFDSSDEEFELPLEKTNSSGSVNDDGYEVLYTVDVMDESFKWRGTMQTRLGHVTARIKGLWNSFWAQVKQ